MHIRGSRIFFQGGPGPMARKQSGQRFPQLILHFTEEVQCFFITEKTILEGVHISRGGGGGGVQLFPGRGGGGGSKCLFL